MATAWTVNAEGEVWTIQPQGGGQLMAPAESALQVALGFDGTPWMVTTQRSSGAGNLVQYYAAGSGWETLPSSIGAVQIAGSTNGFAYIVDENNAIWAITGTTAPIRMSADGFALTVGVSSVGPAWAISTQSNEDGGGNVILWYNNANGQWTPVPAPAAAIQIAGQYDVMVSETKRDRALTREEFESVHDVGSRFYSLIVVDTANDESAANWRAAVQRADALVVPLKWRNDYSLPAIEMLEELQVRASDDRHLSA